MKTNTLQFIELASKNGFWLGMSTKFFGYFFFLSKVIQLPTRKSLSFAFMRSLIGLITGYLLLLNFQQFTSVSHSTSFFYVALTWLRVLEWALLLSFTQGLDRKTVRRWMIGGPILSSALDVLVILGWTFTEGWIC